jgi:hypothetical protein
MKETSVCTHSLYDDMTVSARFSNFFEIGQTHSLAAFTSACLTRQPPPSAELRLIRFVA